ncbi:TldD/PmbA family protein [Allokutzneria sp. A3M-2-11 16]|uniref:TldD/PmbA family protein n=1 Tax=Allokutzneria sp. A3M-2-11 16 TaxID=2962043 RepID=UPI0020B6F21F|nr:TldD/PmbA family protein [Allokutzneria sp. A3M-2-11 16]MCP3801913.1 TldD/PmbA family protein [Allokutzneria sp. A3M-2-11 16]
MDSAERIAAAAFSAARRNGAAHTVVHLDATTEETTGAEAASAVRHTRREQREVGVRVHRDGAVGLAYGVVFDQAGVVDLAERACLLARRPRSEQAEPPPMTLVRSYRTPVLVDPDAVSPAEREELAQETVSRALAAGCDHAAVEISVHRRETRLLSSAGGDLVRESIQTGGWVRATADGPSGPGVRTYPERTGRHAAAGWEHVLGLGLPAGAERAAREAVLLSRARPCPEGEGSVVIDSSQLALQIHESIGHPLEQDRVLGWEIDYAGDSFVSAADVGSLAYGSEHVSVVADPTGTGIGAMPWDDEGTPTRPAPLIDRGVLVGLLSSESVAAAARTPLAAPSARTEGAALPLVRMTNVNLLPGSGSQEDLLSSMGNGILLCGNRSFSIDARREEFHFTCELAWRVRGGEKVEPLRNPRYHGRTLDFWRSCEKVAGADEWAMHSVTFCMKGNPVQIARVGHGASPALFSAVRYGSF